MTERMLHDQLFLCDVLAREVILFLIQSDRE